MIRSRPLWPAGIVILAMAGSTFATERYFTYTYEPEVFPQGASEFEQWVTWAAGRDNAVRQEAYNRWELREEFEYGVTDRYSVSLYLNTESEMFRDPVSRENHFNFRFDGVSVENRYLVLNPAEHLVGLTLYLEPRFSGDEAEVEEKIILGQRCGNWKWALNFSHATEWADDLRSTEGEVELDFGLTRELTKRWSAGLEARDHNELPEYDLWENTALFLGPCVTYTADRWWATLSALPQIYGNNFHGNPDGVSNLDLEGHERVDVRLIVGMGF